MTLPAHASLESTPSSRRPWAAPQLTAHASMSVLTQSVLGVSDVMLLLQGIGGSTGGVGGGGVGPSGTSAGQPVTAQGGASGPPRH
ncbi:MAG TPA: hypothetical protein VFW04_17325 [Gemmatimonadaceae bacterium]|nr:hypothetical protein [Gemmatimonadaceae bacterium]